MFPSGKPPQKPNAPNMFASYEEELGSLPDEDLWAQLYENPVVDNMASVEKPEEGWAFYGGDIGADMGVSGSGTTDMGVELTDVEDPVANEKMANMLAMKAAERKDASQRFQNSVSSLNKKKHGGY